MSKLSDETHMKQSLKFSSLSLLRMRCSMAMPRRRPGMLTGETVIADNSPKSPISDVIFAATLPLYRSWNNNQQGPSYSRERFNTCHTCHLRVSKVENDLPIGERFRSHTATKVCHHPCRYNILLHLFQAPLFSVRPDLLYTTFIAHPSF